MKKPSKTPTQPSPRTAMTLDTADLRKIVGGCTNENLTTAVIK